VQWQSRVLVLLGVSRDLCNNLVTAIPLGNIMCHMSDINCKVNSGAIMML
jgi:hypothetical protein